MSAVCIWGLQGRAKTQIKLNYATIGEGNILIWGPRFDPRCFLGINLYKRCAAMEDTTAMEATDPFRTVFSSSKYGKDDALMSALGGGRQQIYACVWWLVCGGGVSLLS